jgi:hypothetical protein
MKTQTRKPRIKKSLTRLYWEGIKLNWQLWLLAILVGLSILGGVWLTHGTLTRTAEIPTWPSSSALIEEIRVTQKSPLDPLTVVLELSYEAEGKKRRAHYHRSWTPAPAQPNPQQWKTGDNIMLRYQPDNPNIISLFPDGP